VKNVQQIPMLAAILLAMGSVAEERAHGISAMVLCRPISRAAYVLAKLTGHGLTLLAGLALGALVSFYYLVLLFDGAALGPFLLINVGLLAMLIDLLAITLLCSTLLRSGVAAGGLAFVLYILLSILPDSGRRLATASRRASPTTPARSWPVAGEQSTSCVPWPAASCWRHSALAAPAWLF